MYEADLESKGIEYTTYMKTLEHVDRCMCEGVTDGFVKISVKKGTDEIVGVSCSRACCTGCSRGTVCHGGTIGGIALPIGSL